MAKITTTYDSTLKEKAFIVKGEEAYARTTDCVLTELFTNNGERRTDWDKSLDNMKLEFRIDVFRDVGASQVVLYDNDITLGVFNLDTNSHRIDLKWEGVDEDNRIELAYGIEHNIYAKYMGNKQCLKSQSKTYTFLEEMPEAYECSLSFTNSDGTPLDTDFHTGHPATFKVKLTAEDYYGSQPIEVYYDTELLGEYTTDSNGLTEAITISDLTEGKHKLSARFNGYSVGDEDYLVATSTSKDISVGYIVTILEYPQYVINSKPSAVKVKVTNQFNTPMENVIVYVMEDGSPVSSSEVTMNGTATITDAVLSNNLFYARAGSNDTEWYNSDNFTTNSYTNAVVSWTADTYMTASNLPVNIVGNVSNVSEPVAVTISNVGTVTTNATGRFSANYMGQGAGDINVTASVYNSSDTTVIEDLLQYWKAPSTNWNREYDISGMTLTDISSGYQLKPIGEYPYIRFVEDGDYSVEFTIVGVRGPSNVTGSVPGFIVTHYESLSPMQDLYLAPFQMESNTKVRFSYRESDGYGEVYVNNSFLITTDINEFIFAIAMNMDFVTINNVKVKRL